MAGLIERRRPPLLRPASSIQTKSDAKKCLIRILLTRELKVTGLKKKIGNSDIEVSGIGLGCWPIGGKMFLEGESDGYSRIDDKESLRAIHAAVDAGITLFDTADVYGGGHSEKILGQALEGKRDKVVLATKFGFGFNEETRWIYGMEHNPKYISLALEGSLKRLNTDYIDLYQLHSYPANREEILAIVAELETLVCSGKIKAYGWSIDDPDQAAMFAGKPNCRAMQFSMNIFNKAEGMVDFTQEQNLAALVRSPLGMGLLSGKYTAETQLPADDVRSSPFDWVSFFEKGTPKPEYLKALDAVREILKSDGRNLVQGALAYLWAKADNIIPIPGFRNVQQALENAKAMQFGPLSAQQVEEIETLLERA